MVARDPGREQFEHWNGPGGERWVREHERLDRVLAPISAAVLGATALQPGERAIDVGCGCGTTTLELAARVGARGSVLGVDISAPMLARARELATAQPWVRFEHADATTYAFAGDADLVFSRFGVMFFPEPTTAFTNLRRALRPAGRLCLVCWRSLDENPWLAVPVRAAESVLGPRPTLPPGAPSPHSLASAEHTRALLAAAGFVDIALTPLDLELEFSTTGMDEAIALAVLGGPVATMLLNADADATTRTIAAVRAALEPHAQGPRIALQSACWIVTARSSH